MKSTRVPFFLLALLVSLGLSTSAFAQPLTPGECTFGETPGFLDANDVLATISSSGSMFFGPGIAQGASYIVPRNSESSPLFAGNIWIGGNVGGELRLSASSYGQAANNRGWELFPGPLNDDGTLPNPADCSEWDRIWKVTRQDILDYETTGVATPDMESWPAELGAPVIDGDGNPGNYNLSGGDRPDIIGDQSLWWILNDVGGPHPTTLSDPIGVEIQVQAFAFARANALNQTTFYKYTITYKGNEPLEDTRITLFSDPDLGDAGDDLIGSDTTLSMGYVYNGGVTDGVYGTPPALGYDFFQGALVPDPDGSNWNHPEGWEDPDGTVHPDSSRLGMTTFNYYNNEDSGVGNPQTGTHYWNYMQGLWRDGVPFRECGFGRDCDGPITLTVYAGDPVTGSGFFEPQDNGADKRFLITTGPFDMQPGEVQEIVFGIVFAQGAGRLESLSALRGADQFAQAAYDANFELAEAAPPPPLCTPGSNNPNLRPGSGSCFEAGELDEELDLVWGYSPNDPGYLGDYEDIFEFEDEEGEIQQDIYEFEGFNLYEYGSALFENNDRRLIATFDKANGITTVFNGAFDTGAGVFVPQQTASGEDTGLNYSVNISGLQVPTMQHSGPLQNYTDYYYGITTYAVDHDRVALQEEVLAGGDTMTVDWGDVGEAVVESPARLLTVRPSNIRNAEGGTTLGSEYAAEIEPDRSGITTGQTAFAQVIDPTKVTGDTYEIRWKAINFEGEELVVYDIVNATKNEVIFDGAAWAQAHDGEVPYQEAPDEEAGFEEYLLVADGIKFLIPQLPPGFTSFEVVANASGPLPNPVPGSAAFNELGYPIPGAPDVDRPGPDQQANSDDAWLMGPGKILFVQGPDGGLFFGSCDASGFNSGCGIDGFVSDVIREGVIPYDWEIRFVEDPGSLGNNAAIMQPSSTQSLITVPFELWNIGVDTPDDPSDDVRYFPMIFEYDDTSPTGGGQWNMLNDEGLNNGWLGGFLDGSADHGMSGGTDDPMSDQISWLPPADPSASGEEGFEAWLTAFETDFDGTMSEALATPFSLADMVFEGWGMGETSENPAPWEFNFPEPGTVFRLVTVKPAVDGDAIAFHTSDFAASRDEGLTQEDVDRIAVVPNPYMGLSPYESTDTERAARFTNLPEQATIRIFTVSGTLIRTLEKDNSSRSFDWNLRTENDLPIASGLYLVHIELPGSGLERVLKFGVVNRQTQIDLL